MEALEVYLSTLELIGASVIAVIAIAGFVWWWRDHTAKEHIAALNTRIAGLQDTNNQHVQALNTQIATLQGLLSDVKDSHDRITNEVGRLRAENDTLASTIKALQTTAPQAQQPQLTTLAGSSATIARNIDSMSQANTQLGTRIGVAVIDWPAWKKARP